MKYFYSSSIWKALRIIVLKRDGHKCQFCPSTKNLHVHHIRPLSKGGQNDLFNLITLCSKCHGQDHNFINEWGCCTIPGPDWESYRDLITIPEDVDRYRNHLIENGYEPEF